VARKSAYPHLRGSAMLPILCTLVMVVAIACGGSPTQAVVSSPSSDTGTQNYVALIRSFWSDVLAADEVSLGNVAARTCLGKTGPAAATDMQLVDPSTCRERAVAHVAAQQKFLSELDSTPAPTKFAADDHAFRTQIPKTIADLKAMISAADTGSKDAVVQATTVFLNDMIPTVTGAMDDVDPSVRHGD
jgi:hypothetical protein